MSLPNPLFTILLFCTTAAWAQPPQQWLLAADRVFDGETLHEQHALLIDGDTIVALAPRSEFALDSLQVIELGLLPGFIEPHAHLAFADVPPEVVLRHGITTLRDLGGPIRPDSGGGGSLRILSAGPILTPESGYPIPSLGTADIAWPVTTADEGLAAVRQLAAQGVDIIKIALEPGGESGAPWSTGHGHGHGHEAAHGQEASGHLQTPDETSGAIAGDWPVFPAATVKAIVDQAHTLGLEVIAHIGEERGAAIALDAGVDQWAHVPCTAIPDALLQRAASQGVKIITTSDTLSRCPGIFANLQSLAAHGADLYYGSEIAHPDVPWGINGQELANLVQYAGMTPQEAVSAATAKAGRLLGMPLLGVLREGAVADIIAVPGNPLISAQALKVLEYPSLVISGGVIVEDNFER
jgi:imidazolonepropionase-like amidohydrolase